MFLLAINSYDKDEYVERWIEQISTLDRTRWAVQIVTNGPSGRVFSEETIRCLDGTPATGYRSSLASHRLDGIDVVVSVHAKVWLPDLDLLDVLVERLQHHEAVMFPRSMVFNGDDRAEFCFLFAMKAEQWRQTVNAFCTMPTEFHPEVSIGMAIDQCRLNVLRIPFGLVRSTEDRTGHWITNVCDSGRDLYGCEPCTDKIGFGHYLKPGGYTAVSVDQRGVVKLK